MAWVILLFAGVLEAVWAIGLKRSNGFSEWGPSLYTVLAMAASVWLLGVAMREIPIGIAYAIWTAIGTLLVFIFGALCAGQSISLMQALCVLGLVACCLGLKFA
ncbi:multidrug efflux SMR transporter [Pseudomonas sp. 2FE]|uniref:DMT family transporter n=1 Tax=Pseudomonas sp. 2FE TaxID=2502190 RepID=UPI0010F7F3A5|nr:multidrug efflux SMR transporter [Pseudomonas sp. 2FE]